MKKRILLSVLLLSVITLAIPVAATQGPVESNSPALRFKVNPVKVEEMKGVGEGAIVDPVPWNLDMVNAEATENDGEGIYVAVLDTGLLSNFSVQGELLREP